MIEKPFDSAEVKSKLEALPDRNRLASAWACCTRMLPNYARFQSEAEGWGNAAPLRQALAAVWRAATAGEAITESGRQALLSSCEAAAPNSDDFDSLYTSSAQDMVFATCSLLDYLGDPDLERLVNSARYPTDSIDLYVQESEEMSPSDPQLERKILRHPLMQQELLRQERDFRDLGKLDLLDTTSSGAFRARAELEDIFILQAKA